MSSSTALRERAEAALAQPTLCAAFQITARTDEDGTALATYRGDEVVSWRQFADPVRALAGGLDQIGVRPEATLGDVPLRSMTIPALSEFSEYGGIHRIDGRPTGVLPDRIARFGVGIIKRREIIP